MRADWVLYYHRPDFFVAKRVGTKISTERLDHFVSFHSSEKSAWKEARRRQKANLELAMERFKYYDKKIRGIK